MIAMRVEALAGRFFPIKVKSEEEFIKLAARETNPQIMAKGRMSIDGRRWSVGRIDYFAQYRFQRQNGRPVILRLKVAERVGSFYWPFDEVEREEYAKMTHKALMEGLERIREGLAALDGHS